MTLQLINFLLDDWVPNQDVVVETRTENKLLILNPIQRVDLAGVIGVHTFSFKSCHVPEA